MAFMTWRKYRRAFYGHYICMEITTTKVLTRKFLGLPAEIRNQIYRYVVVSEFPVTAYIDIQPIPLNQAAGFDDGVKHAYKRHPDIPALSQTNRQVREEAFGVFFGEDVFCVTYTTLVTTMASHFWRVLAGDWALRPNTLNHGCAKQLCKLQLDFPILKLVATNSAAPQHESVPASIYVVFNKHTPDGRYIDANPRMGLEGL